jgi:aspartyl-tRNA(Asn)/glutamyl-tRNA(Gln) amidotransferase subunit A
VGDYVAACGRDVRGLRVGVPRNYFFEGVDAEIVQAFEEAMGVLRGLGAEVRDVTIPSLAATHSFLLILLAEAYAYHERDLRERPQLYGEVLRERFQAGGLVTAAEYTQAQRLRAQICAETAGVLRDVDVLATPTTPKPATAFAVAHDPEFGFPRSNMPPFNITGLPTLALPCGFSPAGLPLSLQLSGRPFAEETVLRLGHAYEQATPWHTRRPQV